MRYVWHDIEQRTPEWFALRLGIPTASNFHKIITPKTLKMSEQRFKYRNQLLAEWATGIPAENFTSKSMEAGTENEDKARSAYEAVTDSETKRPGFFTAYDGMAGASPDALIDPSIDVEIKTRELHTQIGWALFSDDTERQEHRIQCQSRLMIEEREWSHLWNYNEGLIIPVLKFPRDEKCIETVDAAVRQFIDELLAARQKLTRDFGIVQKVVEPEPDVVDYRHQEIELDIVDALIAGGVTIPKDREPESQIAMDLRTYRKRLGDEAYLRIMGNNGYDDANDVKPDKFMALVRDFEDAMPVKESV